MSTADDGQPAIHVNGHTPSLITCGEIRARLPPQVLPLGEPVKPAVVADLVATDIPVRIEHLPADTFHHPQGASTLRMFLEVRTILREGFGIIPPARLVVMRKYCYAFSWVVAVDFGEGPKFFRLDCCDDGFDMSYTLSHQWRSTWEECFADGWGRRLEGPEEGDGEEDEKEHEEHEDEEAQEDPDSAGIGYQPFTLNEAALDAFFNRWRDEAMLRRLLSGLPDESIAPPEARDIWTRLEYGPAYATSDEESTESLDN